MRGQITHFVIFGVIIVGAVFLLMTLRKTTLKEEGIKSIAVPEQAKPVKEVVDSCINGIASDGANLMGFQAGYINVPADSKPRSIVNQFSNNLEIFPNTDIVVPYWYYLKSNNVEKTQIPKLKDMENELASYIEWNLKDCLANVRPLADNGYEINFGDAETDVTIGNER
ncbi:hypothetical protein HYT58_03125 [Candidatus Woesearchaeota archaeon]|nr:hypothetical protein [Candidatus Woesearchaeota archaeon]